MTKRGKNNAALEARKVLARYGISNPPVAVDRIARGMGAALQFVPLDDELSGIVFIKDDVPVIAINAIHHPNRQRFSIAHEIGHLVLHRGRINEAVHVDKTFPVLRRDAVSSAGVDLMEIEANRFAAELLMPETFLKDDFASPLDIDDEGRVIALAKKFKVSASAMRYRLLGYFSD